MKKLILILIILLIGFSSTVRAKDIYIRGYNRKDGTYVNPYIRKSPNTYKWDNYGRRNPNSTSTSYQYYSPYTRDNDRDGIWNQNDLDDNNNGILDDNE